MKQTNANLASDQATKAMMRWLVAAGLDNSYLTYGEARSRLENELGFERIARAGRTGLTAGTMIEKLLRVAPDAPLLNILLVERHTELPSDGAGSFLAARFNQPRLAWENAKDRFPKLWRKTFDRAAGEVYATGAEKWQELFLRAYGEALNATEIEADRERRKRGNEEDGLRYGRKGEGPNHKALRLWVQANPTAVRKRFSTAVAETEVVLDSADRVDVVFNLPDEVVAVEVKSRDSNLIDLRRGVFQCIKYRAVLDAMDIRESDSVSAMLVGEGKLPPEIKAMLKLHDISWFEAPMDR